MGLLMLSLLWSVVIAAVSPSVPRLELKVGKAQGICSAVVFEVDGDQQAAALTAAHCVAHDPTAHFDVTANGRHAEIAFFNEILDLAVIRFKAHKETAIPLAPSAPEDGAEVMVIGYAYGVEALVKKFGRVAQSYNQETKTVWLDAVTIPGDSGGAVVDDQGRLVAINSLTFGGLSAAIHLESIREFVDTYHRKIKEDAKRK